MKRIILIIISVTALLTGCTKNFEPQIFDKISPSTFPKSPKEFELYTLDVYRPFGAEWGYSINTTNGWEYQYFSPEYGIWELFDSPTDEERVCPVAGQYKECSSCNFASFASSGQQYNHFEKIRLVTEATKIIDDLNKATVMTANFKNSLIGEAKMARGWNMFYLLYLYGPVPVILDPAKIGTSAEADGTKPTRTDFVSYIASDLRFAADNLPLKPTDYGRFNKGLALTVLMRLYLNEKDFVNAEKVGNEIYSLKAYSLLPNYADLFKEATEQNSETIWAVSCLGGSDKSRNFNPLPALCHPIDYKGYPGWSGEPYWSASVKFYNSFDSIDKRRALMKTSYINSAGATVKPAYPLFQKYELSGGNDYLGNDIVVCRFADVMLMEAEAINENRGPVVEAVNKIDSVRFRAGIGNLPDSAKVSKDALREAIFVERGHELYLEGLRKFDLVRMGKWDNTYMNQYDRSVGPSIFPIPTYAIISFNGSLKQNDGY